MSNYSLGNSVRAFSSALTLSAIILLGSGCTHSSGTAESQTPQGCDRTLGRYFDPQTHKCVKAATPTQAYLLDKYRYVDKVAGTTKTPLEWRINFSRKLNLAEYAALMGDLSPDSISYLRLYFPDIDHGLTISRLLPDGTNFTDAPSTVMSLSKADRQRNSQAEPGGLQEAFTGGQFTLWLVRVKAPPAGILRWWNSHLSDVLFVQPMLTDMDKIQPTINPESSTFP